MADLSLALMVWYEFLPDRRILLLPLSEFFCQYLSTT